MNISPFLAKWRWILVLFWMVYPGVPAALGQPAIASVVPAPDSALGSLTEVTVTFTAAVTGVQSADLLVNGSPANSIAGGVGTNVYTFSFTQPSAGPVQVLFDANHTITDLAGNRFDETASGASWQYSLADTLPPAVIIALPIPGAMVGALTRIEVTFNEPVTGVEATDLQINGQPASQVTGALSGPYTFDFPQPGLETVNITWAGGHGIRDTSPAANLFAGGGWSCLLNSNAAFGDIVINEFLADNLTGLVDEDDQKEDWIELWNRGANDVNLLGWSLTDDPTEPGKWTFPAITLNAGQYLLVLASGKDRKPTVPGSWLHSNFRLSVDGEYVGIYNAALPRGVVSEYTPAYPEQRGDVSYGLTSGATVAYFTTPTPGATNSVASVVAGVVQPPAASVKSGFFDQPFAVVLSTGTAGAEIHYTTNGSVPTLTSPLYTGPLPVAGGPLKAVVLLRAAAFKSGWLSSRATTHSYLFPDHVPTQPANPEGFPVVWDSPCTRTNIKYMNCNDIPADYEMDPQIVTNGNNAALIRAGLTSLPTLSIVTDVNLLFGPAEGVYVRREDWNQQPVNVELILPDGANGFNVTAGLEIQGGTSPSDEIQSWKSQKLSMRLLFKGDFGARNLEYPLFADSSVMRFNTLVLDNGLNYFWHYNKHNSNGDEEQRVRAQYVRDTFMSDLQRAISGTSAHWRFMHFYLNGIYWGITGLHERPDDKFAEEYFGGAAAEYDVLRHNTTNIVAGDNIAYNQMLTLARSGLANAATYEALQQHLDLSWFIDYILINLWAGNTDWAHQNWYACRQRTSEGRWRYLSWDAELVIRTRLENRLTRNDTGGPTELFQLLRANAEFRLAFADHIHRHFFNGGVFSLASNTPVPLENPGGNQPASLYLKRIREIDAAMVGESARWGDSGTNSVDRSNNPLTREGDWISELLTLMGWTNAPGHTDGYNYFPTRTATVLNQFKSANLYPYIIAPAFNQYGGRVATGFLLTMTAPAGTIYYTTNGTDPRVYGSGTVSAQALTYAAPVPLHVSGVVKARVRSGTTWSALNEAEFTVGELGLPLRFTEIHYNASGGEAYEFLELQNVGVLPVAVGGFSFQGINFVFPEGKILAAGAVVVLVNNANPAAFAAQYPGVEVGGYFSGNLSNGGERIALLDREGQTVLAVHYDDEGGWPTGPDGGGYSLEILDPWGDPNAPANWRASSGLHGTPGLPPAPRTLGEVVLNEVMADNGGSVTNDGAFPDWVELHNRGDSPVDLAHWSLSDSSNARKFVFPVNTIIPASGHLVVWCDSATASPGLHTGFALGKTGETVSLFDANTNRVDALTFGLQLTDYSVGRLADEWALTLPTPGATNVAAALASATNLALNEWLAGSPPGSEDWLELFNRSSNAPVALQGLYLSTSNALSRYAALSFVAPRGYVQLWTDELAGAQHLEFKLPAGGGQIVLHDATGAELEAITYDLQIEGVSVGRLPDGAASIVAFPGSASPETSNYLLGWTGPVLNEVLARNQRAVLTPWGDYADFVELFNPEATNVNLAGLALGKSLAGQGRWTFPAGTSIAAGGYLRVWCDSSRAASTSAGADLNTGFSLNGESGDVALLDALGKPVDWVSYGFQIQDFSIGRSEGAWQLLATPTPGMANAGPSTLGTVSALRINEWMADPLSGDDWFELYNTNSLPVELSELFVTDDPSITGRTKSPVVALSFIGGQRWVRFIADGNRSAGRDHVNFALDKQGETVRLYTTNFVLIDAVDFGLQAEGGAQGRLPDGANTIVNFATTPTPGAANYLPLTSVVINEVLSHTDPPLEDAVELHNPTASPVNLGGWYLSDSESDLKRYRIPDGTVISAGEFRVFYQFQFGPADGEEDTPPLFSFNPAHGDAVYLSETDMAGNLTGNRTGESFGAAANGVSFGRYTTSVGVDFTALCQRTFGVDSPANVGQFRTGTGTTNAYPLVGPIVISEIMYHLPKDTNELDNDEFVELHNLSATNVPLYDLAHPTNVWRLANAVSFDFPANTSIAAAGYLLVVPFDPTTNTAALAAFRARYGTNATLLIGPYAGKLDNAGETLELWRPDPPQAQGRPDAGFVPYILAERVAYDNEPPWPVAADGEGPSLQRIAMEYYGNDPVNWRATLPTAGLPNTVRPIGTITLPGGGIVRLAFTVQPGLTYQVEYKNDLNDPVWLPLGSPIIATNDTLIVDDTIAQQPQRFYRLSTTGLPNTVRPTGTATLSGGGIVRLTFTVQPGFTYQVEYKNNLSDPVWLPLGSSIPVTGDILIVDDDLAPQPQRFYRLILVDG